MVVLVRVIVVVVVVVGTHAAFRALTRSIRQAIALVDSDALGNLTNKLKLCRDHYT